MVCFCATQVRCKMHLYLSSPWLNYLVHLHHHLIWEEFTEPWKVAPCLCVIFTESDGEFYITLSVLKV